MTDEVKNQLRGEGLDPERLSPSQAFEELVRLNLGGYDWVGEIKSWLSSCGFRIVPDASILIIEYCDTDWAVDLMMASLGVDLEQARKMVTEARQQH